MPTSVLQIAAHDPFARTSGPKQATSGPLPPKVGRLLFLRAGADAMRFRFSFDGCCPRKRALIARQSPLSRKPNLADRANRANRAALALGAHSFGRRKFGPNQLGCLHCFQGNSWKFSGKRVVANFLLCESANHHRRFDLVLSLGGRLCAITTLAPKPGAYAIGSSSRFELPDKDSSGFDRPLIGEASTGVCWRPPKPLEASPCECESVWRPTLVGGGSLANHTFENLIELGSVGVFAQTARRFTTGRAAPMRTCVFGEPLEAARFEACELGTGVAVLRGEKRGSCSGRRPFCCSRFGRE